MVVHRGWGYQALGAIDQIKLFLTRIQKAVGYLTFAVSLYREIAKVRYPTAFWIIGNLASTIGP